jgi:hypothetical protein
MDNVQKHNIYNNVPSSQTFRSYENGCLWSYDMWYISLMFLKQNKTNGDCVFDLWHVKASEPPVNLNNVLDNIKFYLISYKSPNYIKLFCKWNFADNSQSLNNLIKKQLKLTWVSPPLQEHH